MPSLLQKYVLTEKRILAVDAVLIVFLYLNFRADFATAFALMLLATRFLLDVDNKITIPYDRYKTSILSTIAIAGIIWGLYLFLAALFIPLLDSALKGLGIQSIIALQSQRTPILAGSEVTGYVAQTILVPFIENPFFLRGLLEPTHDWVSKQTGKLGIGGSQDPITLSGFIPGIITSLFIGTAAVLFHLTVKLGTGVAAYATTFIFFALLAFFVMARKQGKEAIQTHIINNGAAGLPVLLSGLSKIGVL